MKATCCSFLRCARAGRYGESPRRFCSAASNAKRVVFGALNLRTGTRLFLVRAKSRAADFQAFLALVRSAYRGWHVALLLDEDSSHTARASQQAAAGMTLLWLPTRAPKLNPIETLWGQARDVVSVNKQYATIDEQVERFVAHLQSLSNQEALHPSGVLSSRFWLKAALSQNFCPLAYCLSVSVSRWKKLSGGESTPGVVASASSPGVSVAELERRLRALERENADLREQRTILEKAVAIFSEPPR